MKRREFIKQAICSGIAAGTALSFGSAPRAFAAPAAYDLVAVKGGEPGAMFDRAMEAFGGLSAFVPKGAKVLVKPNIGWDVRPEQAGNTNPALVAQIIRRALEAGAQEVAVFDHTCDHWVQCYKNSGIEDAVKQAGGKIIPGNSERSYRTVAIQGARLREAQVHELYLDADVIINVPVLKHHSSSMVTIGMKNLMGVVWDRFTWHRSDLHQCIADFASFRKPTLTVVDAYNVMMRNGPRGVSVNDVVAMQSLIVSPDMVAADAAAARLFGLNPRDVRYIQLAESMGLGSADLSALSIGRIKL